MGAPCWGERRHKVILNTGYHVLKLGPWQIAPVWENQGNRMTAALPYGDLWWAGVTTRPVGDRGQVGAGRARRGFQNSAHAGGAKVKVKKGEGQENEGERDGQG